MSRPADESSVVSRVVGRVRKPASIIRRTSRLWSRSGTKDKQDSEVAPQTNAVNDLTRLNHDVLQAVMRFLKPKELLLVMHTCRTLYGFGVPLLLRTVHYTHLQQRHDYVLYRHFLLSDPSRFTRIESLRCEYMDYPLLRPDTRHTLFVDFLRYATQLRALDILFDFGIQVDDRILAPIAALPLLRRLHLRGCDWAPFARLLATITVPLAALGVHLHGPPLNFGHTLPPPPDIFTPIAAFRESLVLLELETCDDFDVSAPRTSFPRVQRLVWRSDAAVDAATLAALFPAVHELDVGFSAQVHCVVWQLGSDFDAATAIHELAASFNAVPQPATAQRQRGLDRMQWDAAHELRRVCGPCLSVWLLGLRCGAHELVLDDDYTAPSIVADVVRDVRPARLVMTVSPRLPILKFATLETFIHSGLEELELTIALPEPFLLDSVSKLYALVERGILEQITDGERSLRQLCVGFKTTALYSSWQRDMWQQHYARVNWDFLAKAIFVYIPSMLTISFDVTDYTSSVWHRNQCEGELPHDSLFRDGPAKSPPTAPTFFERILRR